jgi:hypothetical protein
MTLSLKTHEYTETNGLPVLTRVNPYIRLSAKGEPPMFLQGGNVYPEGQNERPIPEERWPAWLSPCIENLTPEAKVEVGFSKWVPIPNGSTPQQGTTIEPARAPVKKEV